MIHYELRCQAGHGFDGWFRDSGTFDQQARRGQIACPTCSDTKVERALMAPRVARSRRAPLIEAKESDRTSAVQGTAPGSQTSGVPKASAGKSVTPTAPLPMPDEVRVFLQRLRSEVEQKCTYVGPDFADEARRMHDGETEVKPIYGEATPEEAEALHEDGIDIARIPWVPRSDS